MYSGAGRGRDYGEDGDCDGEDDEALTGPELKERGLGAGGHPGMCGRWRREEALHDSGDFLLSRLAPRNFGAPNVRDEKFGWYKRCKICLQEQEAA